MCPVRMNDRWESFQSTLLMLLNVPVPNQGSGMYWLKTELPERSMTAAVKSAQGRKGQLIVMRLHQKTGEKAETQLGSAAEG